MHSAPVPASGGCREPAPPRRAPRHAGSRRAGAAARHAGTRSPRAGLRPSDGITVPPEPHRALSRPAPHRVAVETGSARLAPCRAAGAWTFPAPMSIRVPGSGAGGSLMASPSSGRRRPRGAVRPRGGGALRGGGRSRCALRCPGSSADSGRLDLGQRRGRGSRVEASGLRHHRSAVAGTGHSPRCPISTGASAVPRCEGGRKIRQFVYLAESDEMEAKLSLGSIPERSWSVTVSFPGSDLQTG